MERAVAHSVEQLLTVEIVEIVETMVMMNYRTTIVVVEAAAVVVGAVE